MGVGLALQPCSEAVRITELRGGGVGGQTDRWTDGQMDSGGAPVVHLCPLPAGCDSPTVEMKGFRLICNLYLEMASWGYVSLGFIFVIITVVSNINGSCLEQAACLIMSALIISNKSEGITPPLAWVAAPPHVRELSAWVKSPPSNLHLFDSSPFFFFFFLNLGLCLLSFIFPTCIISL